MKKKSAIKLDEAAISFKYNGNGNSNLTIEIHDQKASTTFVEATLSPQQVIDVMSGLHMTPCDVTVNNLDKVGSEMVVDFLVVELPDGISYEERKKIAYRLCVEQAPEGVEVDNYFGLQSSFFSKDDKLFARATTRYYVK